MYFFVDESGNTGSNLFDENQPFLYYGVISSQKNIDDLALADIEIARQKLGVDRLHAAEIGMGGLVEISSTIFSLSNNYQIAFDFYRVVKHDHAIISFFDQIFDQGLNPAVPWTSYWTPLRYMLLLKVAWLFDLDLAKLAWKARIEVKERVAEELLSELCNKLLRRVSLLPDARSREIVRDALRWVINNPKEIYYNCKNKKQVLDITPNIIGFQSVMHGIASRIDRPGSASSIIVDQQTQFNKAQKALDTFYKDAREVPWYIGPQLPRMDLSNMPSVPIDFRSGMESIGLEVVDVYLWLFKQMAEGKEIAPELDFIFASQQDIGHSGDISIRSISLKLEEWMRALTEPTEDQLQHGRELIEEEEKRRQSAIKQSK